LGTNTIAVGVVGFGFAGRVFHAPVVHTTKGMRLAAVVQRKEADDAAAVTKTYPETRFVRTLEELLAIDEIRLVVIATPNTSHFDLARQCLLAGRDVVIDKPFANTWQEASDLLDLARQHGCLISAYHNSRCHGDFHTVRQLLSSGKLGRLVRCEMHIDRFRPQLRPDAWRERAEPGSGIFFDLGPHVIDQALALFGTPGALSADIRAEREGAVDDAFDLVLHYPRLRVALSSCMLAAAPRPRFLLHGTAGSYVKYGADPQEDALRQGKMPGSEGWGREPHEKWGTLSLLQDDGQTVAQTLPTDAGDYRQYYENVRDAMHGSAPLVIAPKQILDVMRAIELGQKSSQERRTVDW
jgi:scyllo-inositol 2-dehydrogenase (NADP+)